MKISVIVSTYNNPDFLNLALVSYRMQDDSEEFEVIVADDGSGPSTTELIKSFDAPFQLTHVWHEDEGFRKTKILNRAIEHAKGDYLIFTDHDCIAPNDFVSAHRRLAKKRHFLSGGVEYLTDQVGEQINAEVIRNRQVFDPEWLAAQGLILGWRSKANKSHWTRTLLDRFSTTRASFNGHNTSAWKADIEAVNGFDERLGYGGLDRELGERLVNSGVRGVRIRYRTFCLHLNHSRPYRNEETMLVNRAIRAETKVGRKDWTDFGLVKKEANDAR